MDVEVVAEKDTRNEVEVDEYKEPTQDEPLNERQAIAEKYNQRRHEELGIEDEVEEPDKEVKSEPEQIEVTINGVKKMVDKARVDAAGGVENYQKNVAANVRLQEAAQERKRIEQERQRFYKEREELQRQQRQFEEERLKYAQSLTRQPQADKTLPPADEQSDLVSAYNEAMFEGDTEQANDLLKKITAANKPTVDIEAIKREAAQAARQSLQRDIQITEQQRKQREIQQANAEFQATYPDIVSDENLYQLTNQRTITIQQEHPDWNPAKVIDEAARQTLAWKQRIASASESDERTNAKRAISSVKSGSGRAQAKPQPKPMTNSEYIESLRRARGQI